MIDKISEPRPGFIDVRGPRFSAGITALLLLVVVFAGLVGVSTSADATLLDRVTDPAFLLLTLIAVLFAVGAFGGLARHPFGILFRRVVQPRLSPAQEFEDVKPPTFAQLVGLIVTGVGVVLGLFLPWAVVVAASFAFVAAFLNSAFGFCLGCELYVLGLRLRKPTAQTGASR